MIPGRAALRVPGNLLLLGEYAVLEEGGLGISLAVDRRLVITVEPAEELMVFGSGGGRRFSWTASEGGPPSPVASVIPLVKLELESLGRGSRLPSLRLDIDSSAFFGSGGAKIGLGSSAAVAAGTAYALLASAGLGPPALDESAFRAALEGHRRFQGGRGSGYDVAASLRGGCALFVGGRRPDWRSLELPWLPPFSIARGAQPVDSSSAIARYEKWKRDRPREATAFLSASNEAVRAFAAAESWDEAAERLLEGARLARELGDAIGVSARIEGFGGGMAKPLGAGNELVAYWAESPERSRQTIAIAGTGPLWSE